MLQGRELNKNKTITKAQIRDSYNTTGGRASVSTAMKPVGCVVFGHLIDYQFYFLETRSGIKGEKNTDMIWMYFV